jgi:ribosomal protein S12 methylthiotransferase
MMVGYPGETREDFDQLMKFVESSRFERLGVFTYSPEEGTSAYGLKDDVPHRLKLERMEALLELQQNISLQLNENKIGKVFRTIIDKKEGSFFTGRSEFDSPEVDNEIIIHDTALQIGNFYDIRIKSATEFDLIGEKN